MAETLTGKRVGELARQARRYGYQDETPAQSRSNNRHGHTLSVRCPLCGERVAAQLSQYSALGTSVPRNLDAAVAEHLTDDYTDGQPVCAGRSHERCGTGTGSGTGGGPGSRSFQSTQDTVGGHNTAAGRASGTAGRAHTHHRESRT